MNRMRALVIVLVLLPACASAPRSLSPAGVAAFQNTRVIKGLDLLRDTAIDANAQTPPLLSTAATRQVVQYHESALKIIHATATGWQATVTAGLDALVQALPADARQLLAPYVPLIKSLIGDAHGD